jgi:hypothetical protein
MLSFDAASISKAPAVKYRVAPAPVASTGERDYLRKLSPERKGDG